MKRLLHVNSDDDASWKCGNPFCGFPHFHTLFFSLVRATRVAREALGAKPGGLLFAVPVIVHDDPQDARREGRRHLRDGDGLTFTRTALTPRLVARVASRWFAAYAAASVAARKFTPSRHTA